MRVRKTKDAVEYQKDYLFVDELEVISYVYDLRYKRNGWNCWACRRRVAKGLMMRWAFLRGAYPPDVVLWCSIACKELLERQRAFS